MNTALPGDERDTTKPRAMTSSLQTLLLGDQLKGYGRAMLQQRLVDSRIGDQRVRAGLSNGWTVGGKTGSGAISMAGDTLLTWHSDKSEGMAYTAYQPGGKHTVDETYAVMVKSGVAICRWWAALSGCVFGGPATRQQAPAQQCQRQY